MNDEDPKNETPRISQARVIPRARPLRLICWLLGGGISLSVLMWCLANFSLPVRDGQSLVRVSPETTWFTEPLDENGDVDYRKIFFDRLPKPLPVEENAFAYYLKAMGSRPYLADQEALDLGLEVKDLEVEPCPFASEWVYLRFGSRSSDIKTSAIDQIDAATRHEWTASKVPIAEMYYQEQEHRLALILQGTEQSQGYWPPDKDCELLMGFEGVPEYLRSRCLNLTLLDSMRLLGLYEIDLSIDRLESALKLVRQFCETHDFQSELAIRRSIGVFQRFQNLVKSGKCTSDQVQRIEKIVGQFELVTNWEEDSERHVLAVLEAILFLGREGHSAEYFESRFYSMMFRFEIEKEEQRIANLTTRTFGMETVDWQQLMQSQVLLMRHLQKLGAGGEFDPNAEELMGLFDFLDEADDQGDSRDTVLEWLQPRKTKTSQQFALLSNHSLFPDRRSILNLQIYKQVTLICCWLYRYKSQQGQFPETLEQLVPEFTTEVLDSSLGNLVCHIEGDRFSFQFHTWDVDDVEKERRLSRITEDGCYRYENASYSFICHVSPFDWNQFKTQNPVDMDEIAALRLEKQQADAQKTVSK